MSTYAIGDVQGCYQSLLRLLDQLQYCPTTDQLWFVGDLINRGPESLKTLRFIRELSNTRIVLGNHDLHFLAIVKAQLPPSEQDTFGELLKADDCLALADWLAQQHLFYHDPVLNFSMVHAGVSPMWTLQDCLRLASEVETVLRAEHAQHFYANMYSNQPGSWSEQLQGMERLRFITNCFTRIRFCTVDGTLDLKSKRGIGTQLAGFMPWFEVPNRKTAGNQIVFGHWAALEGRCHVANTFAVDTGCVWGGNLTALRLEDQQLFSVASSSG